MPDFDFDLRSKILTLRPDLGLAKAQEMIQDIARSYFGVLADETANDPAAEWQDFFTFVCADWVFLSAVFKQDKVSFAIFESDHTFIQDSEDLSSLEVEPYEALVAEKAANGVASLVFPMAEAHPWLKSKAQ